MKNQIRGVILVQDVCEHMTFQQRFANSYGVFPSSPFKFSYQLLWFLGYLLAGSVVLMDYMQ